MSVSCPVPSFRRLLPVFALLGGLGLGAPAATAQDRVTGFVLVDAMTDQDVGPLVEGDTIDLAALPSRDLNVRAVTDPSVVGSVVFDFDGVSAFQVESNAPYALAGDSNGDYAAWTPSVGAHTLTATPWSEAGGSGTAGTALTVAFDVVDGDDPDDPPPPVDPGPPVVHGTLERFHRVMIDFIGPTVTEASEPNPFTDYRLDVTFTHPASGVQVVVPGFYAADGDAAETSANGGAIWRVHFRADRTGTWEFSASFRGGTDVAMAASSGAGSPTGFDGQTGSFEVAPSGATGRDFRAHGFLEYVGAHHLRFSGSGEWFLKGGADSPENLLGYAEFDNTTDNGGSGNDLVDGLHRYQPHVADWRSGDPTWKDGRGKGLIGALNYLADVGMNSVYFLTMNVGGDGREVYPWTAYSERERFDVSKLAQWDVVFGHMTARGIMLHVVTQETENDQLLDGGSLGRTRTLYYRELIARFGDHPAIVWNLGEENTNSLAQREAFIDWFAANDPYDHPLALHTYPGQKDDVYPDLLGNAGFEMPSCQNSINETHAVTLEWRTRSADAGRPWVVCVDEIGPAGTGVKPDADDPTHDDVRQKVLWGNLMAGGAGAEWYFGYQYPHNDLDCEDWRTRATMWAQTRHALDFFVDHLPFASMSPRDELVSDGWCLARPGDVYAVYLPDGGAATLDLGAEGTPFDVHWFDPRNGGALQTGSVATVNGPGVVSLGDPPQDATKDWAVLVTADDGVPIALGSFDAVTRRGTVDLRWEMRLVDGVEGFEVRRLRLDDRTRRTWTLPADARSLVDREVAADAGYEYALRVVTNEGVTIELARRSVDVPARPRPELRASPNPFNPRTEIEFSAGAGRTIAVDVFDARGRHVARLFEGEARGDRQRVVWDATDHASGIYLVRLGDGERFAAAKVTLAR